MRRLSLVAACLVLTGCATDDWWPGHHYASPPHDVRVEARSPGLSFFGLPRNKTEDTFLDRYFPVRSASDGIGGRATVECLVQPTGRVSQCRVVSESPADRSFGEAAIRIMNRAEADAGQRSPGSLVRMSFVFQAAEWVRVECEAGVDGVARNCRAILERWTPSTISPEARAVAAGWEGKPVPACCATRSRGRLRWFDHAMRPVPE